MELTTSYKETEVGRIPGWTMQSIQEIASSQRNAIVGGPFGSDLVSADYVDDGVPVVRGQNMSRKWVCGDFAFVTQSKANALQANLARSQDIIFTQRGTLGQVSLVPKSPHDRYVVSQSQMKLTVNPEVADPEFCYYVFSSSRYLDVIESQTIQTGVPHINLGILRGLPILLPPLAEQRAIAAALSDVDALIERLDALVAKKRAVKTAAMQRLLIGTQRLPGFSGVWATKWLGDIVARRNERVNPSFSRHDEFCVELEHMGQGTGALTGHTTTKPESALKAGFQEGDVLFSKLRSYLRKYWLADREGLCSTEIWVFQADQEAITPEYLFHHVTLDSFIEVASKAHGTHMPRADWKVVKGYELPLPPLKEQRAIAEVLSAMDAEIEALQARRAKTQALKRGMMQELLTGRTRIIDS